MNINRSMKIAVLFAAYKAPYVPNDSAVVGENVNLAVTIPPVVKTESLTVGETKSAVIS